MKQNDAGSKKYAASQDGGNNGNQNNGKNGKVDTPKDPDQAVLIAVYLAIFLSKDMTICELQTMVNILGMLISTLSSILTQREINAGIPPTSEIII
jgi:hypothetical protein